MVLFIKKDNFSNFPIELSIKAKQFENETKYLNHNRHQFDNLDFYKSLYKNISNYKYFKMFKRLRTLISTIAFSNNVNHTIKKTLFKIKADATQLINENFTILNQFKNRIETLLFLKDKLTNTKMLTFVNDLLDSVKESPYSNDELENSIIKGKKIDYDKLKELQSEIFNFLNVKSKNMFIEFYNRSKRLIKINIPEFNEMKPNKTIDFTNNLSCKSFYTNLRSNDKYKFFRSYFEYALDWTQCMKLIPMDKLPVKNMLNYLFYKFKSGTFVEIKDNKISKFVPFYNINFKNNWSDKIKTDSKNVKNKKSHRFEYDKSKWATMNCSIKINNMNETSEKTLFELKDMLEYTLNKHMIKDCEFFINSKDFPLLSKKWI